MRALVLYDSIYGNTKQIAAAIADVLRAELVAVGIVNDQPELLQNCDLLVVGSPINGWRPTQRTGDFLQGLRAGELNGCRVATFDTRMRIFFHGDAAGKIAEALSRAGATVIGEAQGFLVKGKEGPLVDGELERARIWAKTLLQ